MDEDLARSILLCGMYGNLGDVGPDLGLPPLHPSRNNN